MFRRKGVIHKPTLVRFIKWISPLNSLRFLISIFIHFYELSIFFRAFSFKKDIWLPVLIPRGLKPSIVILCFKKLFFVQETHRFSITSLMHEIIGRLVNDTVVDLFFTFVSWGVKWWKIFQFIYKAVINVFPSIMFIINVFINITFYFINFNSTSPCTITV
jgi:hypothetical protein